MDDRKLQLRFLLVLLAGTLLLSFFILKPFLTPLVLAAVLAVVLQPLYRRIMRAVGGWESVAAWTTVVVSAVCILIPLSLLGTRIFYEASSMYGSLIQGDNSQNLIVTALHSVGQVSGHYLPGTGDFFFNLSGNLDIYVKQGLAWLLEHLGTALSSVSALLMNLFIFFMSLFYLLRDGSKIKQAVIRLSPLDDNDDRMVFGRLEAAVNSVIKGNLTVALIQGVLTAIGFTIFGIPNGILWGTVTVVSALIPAVGTSLVLVPGIIFLFVTGNTVQAFGLTVWAALAVGLIDNVLGPRLVGRRMRLHPLAVLLSVLGGIAFFGPIGIFLGPLAVSLLFAFITVYTYLANPSAAKRPAA